MGVYFSCTGECEGVRRTREGRSYGTPPLSRVSVLLGLLTGDVLTVGGDSVGAIGRHLVDALAAGGYVSGGGFVYQIQAIVSAAAAEDIPLTNWLSTPGMRITLSLQKRVTPGAAV